MVDDAETRSEALVTSQRAPSLSLSGVHVRYRLYEDYGRNLRYVFVSKGRSNVKRVIHAVNDVSFALGAGESLGLIGSNGSGKSSLLRAIGGLMPVDEGEILAVSRPTLLGVGAVLRPEFSGRRNVRLGLLAKAVPKSEVQALEEEVIRFSGLEEHIDLPMKTYSSGMRARLQFSIATIDRPDILMVDEALAVGDKDFRERSQQRIEDLTAGAGTFILVSHQLSEVTKMCERAIWLEKGVMRADGTAQEVVDFYTKNA